MERSLEAAKLSQSWACKGAAASAKRASSAPAKAVLLDIHGLPVILIGSLAQSTKQFARIQGGKGRGWSGMAKKEAPATEKKSAVQEEKARALEAARLQIEKQFGKGSLMKMGENSGRVEIDAIPSGSILLDAALGIGGYPRGRVVEIYGPESSGKTTLALHAIAESQKQGGIAAFVDAEHALDPVYAKNLGVNVDELWVSQPDTGEQALEIVESLVRSGAMDIIVVDSVAALVPRAEIEGDMGDSHMGLQARLMSQALRKLTGTISKTHTCLIFINQIRMKIGVMFGNPETTTGGFALKFYSSMRLEVRKVESIAHGNEEVVGNKVRVKVVKNKVAPPFRKAEMDIMFGKGISAVGSLLEAALQTNIVEKAGSWYSYGKERIGQGVENARLFLESNPAVYADVEKKVRAILFAKPVPAPLRCKEPADGAPAPQPVAAQPAKARAPAARPAETDAEEDTDADPGEQDPGQGAVLAGPPLPATSSPSAPTSVTGKTPSRCLAARRGAVHVHASFVPLRNPSPVRGGPAAVPQRRGRSLVDARARPHAGGAPGYRSGIRPGQDARGAQGRPHAGPGHPSLRGCRHRHAGPGDPASPHDGAAFRAGAPPGACPRPAGSEDGRLVRGDPGRP